MAANFIGRVDHLESIELDQELSEHFTTKIKDVSFFFKLKSEKFIQISFQSYKFLKDIQQCSLWYLVKMSTRNSNSGGIYS